MNLKFFLEDLFDRKVHLLILDSLKPELKKIMESVKYVVN